MLKARNFERGTVAARPDQMYGWPGICRVKGKEILVAASERKYHVCPFGREVIIRSVDGGRTWGLPQEIYDSELDNRDSNLTILPDGTIVLTWFISEEFAEKDYCRSEWQPRINRITQKMRDELLGGWLIRSFDGGHTWEETPRRIPTGAEHAGPTTLFDGSLILIGDKKVKEGYKKMAFVSKDAGESWQEVGEVPCPWVKNPFADDGMTFPVMNEYHILELSAGKLLALFRTEPFGNPRGYLFQSNSEDNGRTWSTAKELPVWGFPPHLIRLHSGAILCSYGHRREPWGIRAIISYDEGKTWDTDNIITIDEWKDNPDMGYPVSVEMEPGQILTVYYCSRQDSVHIRHEKKVKGSTPEGLLYARFTLE